MEHPGLRAASPLAQARAGVPALLPMSHPVLPARPCLRGAHLRGLGVTTTVAPQCRAGLRIGLYSPMKRLLGAERRDSALASKIAAGMLSGAVAAGACPGLSALDVGCGAAAGLRSPGGRACAVAGHAAPSSEGTFPCAQASPIRRIWSRRTCRRA